MPLAPSARQAHGRRPRWQRLRLDSDPGRGGTPPEFEYKLANYANAVLDDIYDSMDTALLVSSLGDGAMAYTCSSVGELLVSADNTVDPIPVPRNARAALKYPIYGERQVAPTPVMEADVKGKFIVNKAWKYVTNSIPAGRNVMKGKWI